MFFLFIDSEAYVPSAIFKTIKAVLLCRLLLTIIVFGPKPFYFGTFEHERMQLGSTYCAGNICYQAQKMLSLFFGIIMRKMAAHSFFYIHGFAHINNFPFCIVKIIYTRLIGQRIYNCFV